jgi:hypothetical protein
LSGRALTVGQAAERLAVGAETIAERLAARELVAIPDDGQPRLAAWQFTAAVTLPGLAQVIAAWPGSWLSLSLFAVRPWPDLAGRTPAQDLACGGGLRRVLELLEAISPSAWPCATPACCTTATSGSQPAG